MKFRHETDQTQVVVRAGGIETIVQLHRVEFPAYEGPQPQSTWRKPVVGPPARPFAELQIVDGLEADGWAASWVYRPGKFLSSWEPRVRADVPRAAFDLHERIQIEANAKAGCWDVFAWRRGECLFAELKQARSSDRMRAKQLLWRRAALRLGVPDSSFAIVEWSCGRPAR